MNFSKKEEEILEFWKEKKIFEKSLKQREGAPIFSFYDGPPFATGLPHYGHLVASLMKDIVPRYQTMKGKYVERRWGWDCHGLPIENIVEEELGLKSKKDIIKIGIAKFNEICRSKVMTYRAEWRKIIDRFGRWADMDNDYKTMDLPYMESIWWVFKELWDKGLIYEDYKTMHICPRCETTLAQAEVAEGYKMVKDLSVIVKFELIDEANTFVLAWTTTPWTLPGNVALAVGSEITYVKLRRYDDALGKEENYIVSEEFFKELETNLGEMAPIRRPNESKAYVRYGNYELIEKFKGKKLIGKKYKPPFDYYQDTKLENFENGWKIYPASFVSSQEGTGIAHEAPAFGEEDMELAKKEKLPFIQHVLMDGRFKEEVKDFAGMEVKPKDDPTKTDIEIIKYLAHKNLLFKKEKFEHSYPHCWRCESPLLNYATSSYFVAVTKIKPKMLKNAKKITWIPEHIKEGRFGNWLEGARDWAISRQRFWGSVIPLWLCECGEKRVFGSVAELEEASGKKVTDLHKHIVDEITIPCKKCKKQMKRIPDVLDTWFDSGSMPYAQKHYPFENKKEFAKTFPAEFIAEGVDQTIKWFYYLHVISSAINNEIAFENVVVNGIVLAEDGRKMSKRLKNYPAPDEIFEKYGADAMRYYLATSGVVKAEDLRFSEKEVLEVYRNVIMLLNNILEFYLIYAQTRPPLSPPHEGGEKRGSKPLGVEVNTRSHILDQWIDARLYELTREVTQNLDNYDLVKSARPIEKFINDLSTWYLRRSRDRFKEGDTEGIIIFGEVLLELSKIIAPFTPFIAEQVYREAGGKKESVHLEDWSKIDLRLKDKDFSKVLETMEVTRKIVELGLAKRAEVKIKVRQTLNELRITNYELGDEYAELIKDELNVKKIAYKKGNELKVELDTEITKDLKLEGDTRELIRQINNIRKEMNLTIKDRVNIYYSGEIGDIIKMFEKDILKSTLSEKIMKGEGDSDIHVNKKIVRIKVEKI